MLYTVENDIVESDALPWGEMGIDVYLIENWDHESSMTKEEQYQHHLQQLFKLGPTKRNKSIYKTIIPTQDQITNILEPFRPLKYRAAAATLEAGIFLRLDFSDNEQSVEFWKDALDADVVPVYDGVVVDDVDKFGEYRGICEAEGEHSDCFKKVLRLLPEVILSDDTYVDSEKHSLETMHEWELAKSDEDREMLEKAARNYMVAGTIFVEDNYTHSGEKDELVENEYDQEAGSWKTQPHKTVLQVLFDGFGNVISSLRVVASMNAVTVTNWAAVPREAFAAYYATDLGVHYAPGGKFAPPYNDTSELERAITDLSLED